MKVFVVEVHNATREEVELASDRLWQCGVRAIEERSTTDGVELLTVVGESSDAVVRAAAAIDSLWSWRVDEVDDEAAETWREFATPMWVTPELVVVPAWQNHSFDGNPLQLMIEPGSAFGLGDHPTTELSLRTLTSLMPERLDSPPTVLDVGCGTGVLAVAAVRLGAKQVRAVDVATDAVEATLDNASRNGVGDRIEVDTTSAVDLAGAYDIVLANILAPVLVHLAVDLRRLTAADGHLVISGILANEHDHVLEALSPMKVTRSESLDDWVAITLTH